MQLAIYRTTFQTTAMLTNAGTFGVLTLRSKAPATTTNENEDAGLKRNLREERICDAPSREKHESTQRINMFELGKREKSRRDKTR